MPNSPIYLPFKRGIAISEIPAQKPLLKDEICYWMRIIPRVTQFRYFVPITLSVYAQKIGKNKLHKID